GGAPEPSGGPGAVVGPGAAPSSSLAPKLDPMPKCAFPPAATSDDATVKLKVDVDDKGHVTKTTVLSETPTGEGFASAAKSCMSTASFTPGKDAAGKPTAASAVVN